MIPVGLAQWKQRQRRSAANHELHPVHNRPATAEQIGRNGVTDEATASLPSPRPPVFAAVSPLSVQSTQSFSCTFSTEPDVLSRPLARCVFSTYSGFEFPPGYNSDEGKGAEHM